MRGCLPLLFVLMGDFRLVLPARVDFSSLYPFTTMPLPSDPGGTLVAESTAEEGTMVLHALCAADEELMCNEAEVGSFEPTVSPFVPTGS